MATKKTINHSEKNQQTDLVEYIENNSDNQSRMRGLNIDHRGSEALYTKLDPGTSLTSLFRPISPGRRSEALDVTFTHRTASVRFVCFQMLDTRDQSIFLAIIALASLSQGTRSLTGQSTSDEGKSLWDRLKPKDSAVNDGTLVVETTRYAILQAAGMADTAANYLRLDEIIFRLSTVACRVRYGHIDWGMNMFSYQMNHKSGKILLALNSRLANAISGQQHVRISLEERVKLKTDIAKLVHARLCACLQPGKKWEFIGDKLAETIWGNAPKTQKTRESRRMRIRDAATAVLELDKWKGEITGRGAQLKIAVRRPSKI
jgi:hypothetical protein